MMFEKVVRGMVIDDDDANEVALQTVENAIEILSQYGGVDVRFQYCRPIDEAVLVEIRDALKEKREHDNPQPLTLEQLHKMVGEPVWETAHNTGAVVTWEDAELSLRLFNGYRLDCKWFIDNGYSVYAHKPKAKETTT